MKIYLLVVTLLCCFLCFNARAQSDLFCKTPPMGWNSWNLFEGDVSEKLVKEIADAITTSGMREAGYEYIVIDDLWVGGRDAKNELYAERISFPTA